MFVCLPFWRVSAKAGLKFFELYYILLLCQIYGGDSGKVIELCLSSRTLMQFYVNREKVKCVCLCVSFFVFILFCFGWKKAEVVLRWGYRLCFEY